MEHICMGIIYTAPTNHSMSFPPDGTYNHSNIHTQTEVSMEGSDLLICPKLSFTHTGRHFGFTVLSSDNWSCRLGQPGIWSPLWVVDDSRYLLSHIMIREVKTATTGAVTADKKLSYYIQYKGFPYFYWQLHDTKQCLNNIHETVI